jgi:hypothetical protein
MNIQHILIKIFSNAEVGQINKNLIIECKNQDGLTQSLALKH